MIMRTFGELNELADFMYSGIWYVKIKEHSDFFGCYNARSEKGDKQYFSDSTYVYV